MFIICFINRDFDFAEDDRATLEHRLSELTPDDIKHITEEHIEFPEVQFLSHDALSPWLHP